VRFTRPLLLLTLGDDAADALTLVRALAPDASVILARVCVPRPALSIGEPDLVRFEQSLEAGEEALRALRARVERLERTERAGGGAVTLAGEVVVGEPREAIGRDAAAPAPDLVVFGPCGPASREVVAGLALDAARAHRIAVACLAAAKPSPAPIRTLLHPFDGEVASLAPIGALLRDRADAEDAVVFLAIGALDPRLGGDPGTLAEIAGIRARLRIAPYEGGWIAAARGLGEVAADAILLSAEVGGLAADVAVRVALRALARGERPLIFAPPLGGDRPTRDGELDAVDAWFPPDVGSAADEARSTIAIRVEWLGSFGAPVPLAEGAIELVAQGRTVASVEARAGLLRVPRALLREGSLGLGRAPRPPQTPDAAGEPDAPDSLDATDVILPPAPLDPLGAIEVAIALDPLRARRIALVDARIEGEVLARVREALAARDAADARDADQARGPEVEVARAVVAVRLGRDDSARDIRARWLAAGFPRARVFDVRELLDEGDPTDVPVEVGAVRLARAAARLRAESIPVDVVVAMDPGHARADGFVIASPATLVEALAPLAALDREFRAPPGAPARALGARLDVLTASHARAGHHVHVELDNAAARRELVGLIDGAERRVHAQWYIVADDEISREVEAAFVRAAARGVQVRLLIDSLYSMHGSLGAENALLARLAKVPSVELRASSPIDHVPSLEDLKRRDHRKLLVADGARGLVSGRNLAREYYVSFDEARVSAASNFRELPWLDASVSLEGPAVADLERSFCAAWIDAGGAPFDVAPQQAAGGTAVRVVVHRGLRDAYTLEAYRAIIDAARTRLVIVNSFPLQLELQHALLAARARGVRLQLLVGRARPTHGEENVPFAGAPLRAIADALVRARLSALVDAGADVRELSLPAPGGDPALGRVSPHVHAKIVCADAQVLALGSANLDITAGYWESEALVVIDDVALVGEVQARIDALIAGSVAIDPEDPKWRDGASLREWLGRVWPSVVG
jgi:phosphatidylserine/phosphatidylglycerophosphate/cardiolipin synthase-like enzyme